MSYSDNFNEADYYGPKRLLVIAIDNSASMEYSGLQELNKCLNVFLKDIKEEKTSFSSVEFSVITFNQVSEMLCEVSDILNVNLPQIIPIGQSNIINGIEASINVVKKRVDYYKANGYDYYKPWLVVITNYENQENVDLTQLSELIKKDVRVGRYQFLPVGIGNVSMKLLEQLKASIMPIKLQKGRFNQFFNWLSTTVGSFSMYATPAKLLDEIRPKIFISYKRDDKQKVISIKKRIEEELDLTCWFDVDGIESDAHFANVIISAINECEIFLFMYSHSHTEIIDLDNDWTIREINFAQKKKKRIVFVNIDNTPLTDWFEMMFGTKQQIDANSEESMKKLLLDLSNWLDL